MDIIQELGSLAFASRLKRISERLMKDVSRVYADLDVDFEARWFPVLYLLTRNSPQSITEIARELHLTHPAVNQISGGMSRAGLLASTRDRKDDRKRLLSLTKEGRDLVGKLQPVWHDIEMATTEVLELSGQNLLDALDRIEEALDENDMHKRVTAHIKERQYRTVEIIAYRPRFKKQFKSLNYEWLEKYFSVEPDDDKILSDPNGQIIKPGGKVFFARLDGKIIGTAALIRRDNSTFELVKMAVTEKARGLQAGKKLLNALIDQKKDFFTLKDAVKILPGKECQV